MTENLRSTIIMKMTTDFQTQGINEVYSQIL